MHSMEVRRADHYLLTLFLQRCLLLVTGHHHRSLLWPMGRSSCSLAQTYCSHKQTAALIPSFLPGVVREKNNNNKKTTKWTPHFAFSFKCIRWKVFHIDGLTEQQQKRTATDTASIEDLERTSGLTVPNSNAHLYTNCHNCRWVSIRRKRNCPTVHNTKWDRQKTQHCIRTWRWAQLLPLKGWRDLPAIKANRELQSSELSPWGQSLIILL